MVFSELRGRTKKQKTKQLSTATIVHLKATMGATSRPSKVKLLRVLCDSGCSSVIISKQATAKLRCKQYSSITWTTQAGAFDTKETCTIQFTLPEFHKDRIIEWKAHVDASPRPNSNYDMIIGRDLMIELGMTLDFNNMQMVWDGATAPMKSVDEIQPDNVAKLNDELLTQIQPKNRCKGSTRSLILSMKRPT